MSRFKLEFKLRQHTPIIHFQGDQHGATLRATELKPKLDKFILTRLGGGNYEEGKKIAKNKKWLIGKGEHPALDYKVRIEPDSSPPGQTNSKTTPFFGGLGTNEKPTKTNPKIFTIKFLIMIQELKQYLEENFEAFLANTNFGTRQTKGYGSFYIADKEFDKALVKAENVYSFSSSESKWENDLKDFYSFLRAGINFPCNRYSKEKDCPDGIRDDNGNFKTKIYIKAAIFHYAKSLGITWDKKAIKEYYLQGRLRREQEKYDMDSPVNYGSDDKKLLRDLFGLSSEQDWAGKPVKKNNPDLERFKSPIIFKPILDKDGNVKVYFWVEQDSLNHILNKEFSINYNGIEGLTLFTPKEFSFKEFFKYTFKKTMKDFCEDKYANNSTYKKLNRILSELRSQA